MTHAITTLSGSRLCRRAATVVATVALSLLVLAAHAGAATPAWHIFGANGPTNLPPKTSETQKLAVDATGGTYTLTFDGQTTSSIAFDASPDVVDTALEALSTVGGAGGTVDVEGGPGGAGATDVYLVSFGGSLSGVDVAEMTATSNLTGAAGTATVTTQTQGGTAGSGAIVIYPSNIGGVPTVGPYTVQVDLPPGITTSATAAAYGDEGGWSCDPAGAGQSSFACTASQVIESGDGPAPIVAPVTVEATPGVLSADLSIAGGGAGGSATYRIPITVSQTPAQAGIQAFWASAYDLDGNLETRAGSHPAMAMTGFLLNTISAPSGKIIGAGSLKEVVIDPPVGFVANPLVTPRCPRSEPSCEDRDVIVGRVTPIVQELGNDGGGVGGFAFRNVLPPPGSAAQFNFPVFLASIATVGRLRPDDYGVSAVSPNIPGDWKSYGALVSLWGDPGSSFRDRTRCSGPGSCPLPNPGGVDGAFLTNPIECTGTTLATMMSMNVWQAPEVFSTGSYDSPAITGCEDVPFDPVAEIAATSSSADDSSGLDFDLEVPQDGLLDPDGIAQSHVRDVTVDLPEGLAVNPSGATGLEGCTDAEMAPGTDSVPACPDGSKIGSVEVTSPLADHPIGGTMYLGAPKSTDPTSGEMFRLWVVARDDRLGVMVKLPGSATADRQTGKLTATFRDNPRLPFDHLSVKVRGGDHGVLAMPQTCGERSAGSELSPWSGTSPVALGSSVGVDQACGFGFAPSIEAGSANTAARGTGDFSFELTRPQGDRWVDGITAHLPAGLLASLKGVPLCSNVQANAGTCPESSRIGTVDASAGSGDPFVLEQKGAAYLTEGYKGAPYGMAVKVRAIAGPFRGQYELAPIVVRQRIEVDRSTAKVSVISDQLPTVWHGVPLRVRRVLVKVDRAGFMLNPSDCDTKQIAAEIHSPQGNTAQTSDRFKVGGCANLAFKPKLALSLTGKRQVTTGKHPGIKATVTQAGVSEAGIQRTVVTLPKSLALDPDNAQALCEFADGTKPDLENHCPKGSIVGRARATTPLLDKPLAGNVYFVKNVRIDPTTGNSIRTLPMLIVALRGEIAVNLKGESSTTRAGRLVNTFNGVPDAPISRFNLNIQGGDNGILAVTRTRRARINLCAARQIAETDMDGHNGRVYDTNVRMKTPCTKKQTRAAKRAAKQAASRR